MKKIKAKYFVVARDFFTGLVEKVKLRHPESTTLFKLKISDRIPEKILVHEEPLVQVVTNVLDNSFKFTPCGEVTLEIDVLPEVNDDPPRLSLTMTDSGIGIVESDLENIFKPFFQGEETMDSFLWGAWIGTYYGSALDK